MRYKLIIFVVIMLSLTAYTIYGGILDKEEIAVKNSIEETFETIKNSLSHRDIDIIVRDNLRYKINDIDINNGSATASMELTGLDLAQSFYEMDMFHIFYREYSLNSRRLFTEPILDTYSVYSYILNKNLGNTRTSNLQLQLNKSNGKWEVNNIYDIYLAIENSSINIYDLTQKAYENLLKAREMVYERYLKERPANKTFNEYWSEYLYNFITNNGYVTEFPFENQEF
jgi:hypothetical protein